MPFNLRGGRPKSMKQGVYWVQRDRARIGSYRAGPSTDWVWAVFGFLFLSSIIAAATELNILVVIVGLPLLLITFVGVLMLRAKAIDKTAKCEFIRANGRQCSKPSEVDGLCTYHATQAKAR